MPLMAQATPAQGPLRTLAMWDSTLSSTLGPPQSLEATATATQGDLPQKTHRNPLGTPFPCKGQREPYSLLPWEGHRDSLLPPSRILLPLHLEG